MSMVRSILLALLLVVCLLLNGNCSAQAIEAKGGVQVESETILTGLIRPTGIAVAPGGTSGDYAIFVAEQGAGRVVKCQSDAPDSVVEVITGFSVSPDSPSADAMGLRFGVRLGIRFHGRQRLLVVGDNSASASYALLFELPAEGEVQSAAHPKQRVDRAVGVDAPFGQFCDVTGSKHSIYVATAATTNATEGIVFRANARNPLLGDFRPLVQLGEVSGPLALALNPQTQKGYLAVAQSTSAGSVLTIHDPVSGKQLLETATGLQQIVALAYSPKSGRLYAAESDGIYRLDAEYRAGKQTCRAVPIAKCPHPTSLAFAPDGSLLVAALGELESAAKNQGVVIKLHGNL